jgi:bacterioferritin (cytochrome b1)
MNFSQLLLEIVSDNDKHARWLNTLSLMENSGARKISASEHKKDVTLIILKHAAEEHRHAYYLKKQISKLNADACPTYADQFLLASSDSRYYLNILDVFVCKYLKTTLNLSGNELKFAAYLLVTYAIEVRADELYPVYQDVLDQTGSKVNVKSIILEEEGHLEEMLVQLKNFSPDWQKHADKAVEFETGLFKDWLKSLEKEIADQ